MMIVLSEASSYLEPTPSSRELQAATEAAKLTGCRVYYIPQGFEGLESPSDAFAHIPVQEGETPGVWNGYIPTPEHYDAVYRLALEKRIRLLNTPEEHLRAQEFDRAYERLAGLTPKSIIVTDPDQCDDAIKTLGLPVFVKGAVQSRKARGWKACVAETADEVRLLTSQYLSLEGRTRGRVVLRKLVSIRHVNKTAQGFPIGREYRVFLYRSEILGYGYYWEGDDPLSALSVEENKAVLALAVQAARRLDTPYVAIDIGQLEDGQWIVIESGDAQFSSVSRIPLLPLWHQISQVE
ncbi:hypothetical protein CCAX7_51250 [Capsulimonas corticalis]|uniref:ATP-grasp domain-containing protein n=1 Tax=Capsulimonas corticalis TaxID=2219043 RepID=A0A402CP98_9BACT|nr:ATP-grasp domain-containing protein [Capsulimonas corticalis]BDI33074.1 hypothetical protein CCAX7_51250 [Capsulimonas corticalis]